MRAIWRSRRARHYDGRSEFGQKSAAGLQSVDFSAMAEVIKYGVIWDVELFGKLEKSKRLDQMRYVKADLLAEILIRSCQAKAEVVSKDEKESGLRAILNYGHTIGHAVESLTNYKVINHGEGVAICFN